MGSGGSRANSLYIEKSVYVVCYMLIYELSLNTKLATASPDYLLVYLSFGSSSPSRFHFLGSSD